MTYKVQIGYKVWKSMDSHTFNEIISGTIEHDPYNDCAFFMCGDECLTSETIKRIFQKANDTLHGLMDALIIRIGEAEFYGMDAFGALEEVAGGSNPYEILWLYGGELFCEQPYRATHYSQKKRKKV